MDSVTRIVPDLPREITLKAPRSGESFTFIVWREDATFWYGRPASFPNGTELVYPKCAWILLTDFDYEINLLSWYVTEFLNAPNSGQRAFVFAHALRDGFEGAAFLDACEAAKSAVGEGN